MAPDEYGFLFPKVDYSLCLKCGSCVKACPAANRYSPKPYLPKVYAARIKDNEILKESTSGGVFTALSEYVLASRGFIAGAVFDDELKVVHLLSNESNDRDKMRGAKYVQSMMGDIHLKIKELLDSGIMVLFTGTPCQVHSLKLFLGRPYENLLLVDIVCHGVSSPLFFKNFINRLKKKHGPIVSFRFRSKSVGWRGNNVEVSFADGKKLINTHEVVRYSLLYSKRLLMRDSCFQCPYASPFRTGDLTIGDCWGLERDLNTELNDNKGCSLVIVNSEKGERTFNVIKNRLKIEERDLPSVLQPNLYKSTERPKNIEKCRKRMARKA